jgi:hypothetical protein
MRRLKGKTAGLAGAVAIIALVIEAFGAGQKW